MANPWISTNGTRVDLDPEELAKGRFAFARDGAMEQCDQCGAWWGDDDTPAEILVGGALVRCFRCRETFEVQR